MNKKYFTEISTFASLALITQLLMSPFRLIPAFVFFRALRFLGLSLSLSAMTFWGQKLAGVVPDPTFAFIYLYGFSDEGLTHMLMQNLHKGDIFIDVGAHIGYETLLASKIVGKSGRVFSFEPTPSTYNLLCKNTVESDNVIANNLAVWSDSKFLRIFDYGSAYSGLNGISRPRVEKKLVNRLKSRPIVIAGVSLDDYCMTYDIKPDFIKIDAESAEYDILHGMRHIINSAMPKIVLEIGDTSREHGRTRKCIKFLTDLGYKPYEYKNRGVVPHILKESYFGVYDNLLFIPQK